jgi:hypothetical protein
VVHDQTRVFGSWVIGITGHWTGQPLWIGKSPGWYWPGGRHADVVSVVCAASDKYHSPRIFTFVVAGFPS